MINYMNKYIISIITIKNTASVEVKFNSIYKTVNVEHNKNLRGFPFAGLLLCLFLVQSERLLQWIIKLRNESYGLKNITEKISFSYFWKSLLKRIKATIF